MSLPSRRTSLVGTFSDLRARTPRRPASRPRLESLEDRLLLATRDWDGGGPDNNWMTAGNWVGDVAPQPGVDDLEFPAGASRLTSNNNFPVGTDFLQIVFSGSGGGYQITGHQVYLTATD